MFDSEGDFSDELLELAGASEKKRKKTSSKSVSKRRKAEIKRSDSERELESEDDDANPYPLEGKYKDEADRIRLMSMPEIEREVILATRMDEIQKFQDKRNLEALYRAQRGDSENVAKAAKRSHQARGVTKEKTRKLDELKAKRKAKSEKQRAESPKRERSASPTDMEMSSEDEEDGQISKQEQEEERELRLLNKSKAEDEEITMEIMKQAQLSRDLLLKYSKNPWFEDYSKGAWVRYLIGSNNSGNVYRLCEIISVSVNSKKPYKVDNEHYDTYIELRFGKAARVWPMDRVSNSPFTEDEWKKLKSTCEIEKVKLPAKKDLEKKIQQYTKLPSQALTEADVSTMIARTSELNRNSSLPRSAIAKAALERSNLVQKRTLAQRRRDFREVAEIDAQLATLDSVTGSQVRSEKEDILAKVNERNRAANREAVRRAEVAEAERKRKMWKEKRAAVVSAAASGESRPNTPGPKPEIKGATPNPEGTLTPGGASDKRSVSPLPTSRGPYGKRTFESIAASKIEIDLGDF